MKVAVILSGCGVFDGSEIHEAVCTLLNLDKQDINYQCFAPNYPQSKVMNHFTHQIEQNAERNILVEASRIARGNIKDLRDFNTIDFDAVIFPGGSGAVTNLCNFSDSGTKCKVLPEIAQIITDLGYYGITVTIGNNENIAKTIEQTGAKHQICSADEVVVDHKNLVVSTPAYMLAKSIKEIDKGIGQLVAELVKLGSE